MLFAGMRRCTFLALAAISGGATVLAAGRMDVGRERPYDIDLVPPSSTARWLSFGHPTLLANFYWLRAVQYMGDRQADIRGWEKLYPIVDLVTDLDPRHGYVYQVAGNILGGVGRITESNRILEKGMHNLPSRYILPFGRAVNAMLYEGDYALAGRYFELASATPGAPEHLRDYVLAMYVKGNRADAAIGFLSHLLEASPDEESRKALEKQLQRAHLEKAAFQIDEAIERYRERHLFGPFTVEQLVDAGLLTGIPPDPFGGSWIIDADGRVHSSVSPRRFARPENAQEKTTAANSLGRQLRSLTPP